MLVGGREYAILTPPTPLYPSPPFPTRPYTPLTYFRILSYIEDSPA